MADPVDPAGLVGRSFRSDRRRIGEDDLGLISSLTWGVSELHTNKELMRDHEHGDRMFPGPVLAAVVMGLHRSGAEHCAAMREVGLHLGAVVSFVARYAGPVLVGDEVVAVTTVVAVDPAEGTITYRDAALNQREEAVLSMDRVHRVERIRAEA